MELYISTLNNWSSKLFDQIYSFKERQDLAQNDEFFNTLLIVGFIVSYGLAIQIAISGAFRKY